MYGGFGAAVGGVVVFRALFLGGYDTMKHIYDLDHASVIPRYFVAQVRTIYYISARMYHFSLTFNSH